MPRINNETFRILGVTEDDYIRFCEMYDKDWHRKKVLQQFCKDIAEGKIVRDKQNAGKLIYLKHYHYKMKKEGAITPWTKEEKNKMEKQNRIQALKEKYAKKKEEGMTVQLPKNKELF